MSKILFQLRNRFHDVEGTFTKKEILKKIASGNYTGDEEIAVPPYEQWQKVSSHPLFYDAFLHRIYEEKYVPPTQEELSKTESPSESTSRTSRGKSRIDRATRQGPGKTKIAPRGEGSDEDFGETRNAEDPKTRDFGATIHKSVIDELFPEKSQKKEKTELPLPSDNPDLPPPETFLEGVQHQLDEPLDIANQVTPEEDPDGPARKKRKLRRKILWGSVVALLLVLLLEMGSDKSLETENEDGAALKPLLASTDSKEDQIRVLMGEADSLYSADNTVFYRGALEVLREARLLDETNPILIGKWCQTAARLLDRVPNPEVSIRAITESVKKGRVSDPQFSQFYRIEALVAAFQDRWEDAKKFIGDANEADPTNAENALVLGELFYAQGDVNSAAQAVEESLSLNSASARAHALRAQFAVEQKDWEKVRSEALETLKLDPLHPLAYLALAEAASQQNQLKQAKDLYETAGRLARFGPVYVPARAYLRLGKLEEALGHPDESAKDFRLAHYYGSDDKGEQGKTIRALNVSTRGLKKLAAEMEWGRAYFSEQAEGLVKEEKFQESIPFFRAAQLLEPKDGMALVRLGEMTEKVAASYDDFRRIMNYYKRAIEVQPTLTKAYIQLGLLETELYNLDRGYKLLTQALALSPEEAEPYVALGKHFYKRQDYNESLNNFLKAAKLDRDNSEIRYYAGLLRLLFKKEGVDKAMEFFYQAYTLDPQNYEALVEWLKLKVVTYEKNYAIKFVKNLLEREPKNPNLYWAMGEIYASNKEYQRAITYYHQSLDLDNRKSRVRLSLAKALEAVGEVDKGVAEYRLASLLDRRNVDGFYRAAELLFTMKNYKQAQEVLTELTTASPNYPGAQRYLSKIYQIQKDKPRAIASMQKEMTNNPQNAKFKVEMAELYMDYEQYDEAIAVLTEVTNLPPVSKAPEYVYDKIRGYLLLSRCYRAQNKLTSAEGTIRLALEIDPNDPELHRELGYVYHGLQRDKEAVKAFQYYLSRSPAARDADLIKRLIQHMAIDE